MISFYIFFFIYFFYHFSVKNKEIIEENNDTNEGAHFEYIDNKDKVFGYNTLRDKFNEKIQLQNQ